MKVFFFTLFVGFISSGCCTFSVNEQIRKRTDPINELVPDFEHQEKIYAGLYLGIEEKYTKLYHQYIFKNLLINQPNRVLQILIPLNEKDFAEINEIESEKDFEFSEPAYLLSHFYGFTESYSSDGGISDTQYYFKKYYPKIYNKYSPHMINLWIRPEKERSYVNLIKKNEGASQYYWCSFVSKNNIKWNSRDKTKIDFQKLRYIYSVPVDIITFPFQLIAGLIVASGNSCLFW